MAHNLAIHIRSPGTPQSDLLANSHVYWSAGLLKHPLRPNAVLQGAGPHGRVRSVTPWAVGTGMQQAANSGSRLQRASGADTIPIPGVIAISATLGFASLPTFAVILRYFCASGDFLVLNRSNTAFRIDHDRGGVTVYNNISSAATDTTNELYTFYLRAGPNDDPMWDGDVFIVYNHNTREYTETSLTDTADAWTGGALSWLYDYGGADSSSLTVMFDSAVWFNPVHPMGFVREYVRRPWQLYHRRVWMPRVEPAGGSGTPMNYHIRRAA